MMRPFAGGLMLLALLAEAPARAVEITDTHGFRVDLAAAGGTPCIVWPRHLQRPADCEGIDVRAVASWVESKHLDGMTWLACAIWPADDSAVMMVLESHDLDEPPTDAILESFVRGVAKGAPANATVQPAPDGRVYETTTLAGAPATRFAIHVSGGPPGAERVLGWSLFGKRAAYDFVVNSDAAHEAQARALAEKLIGSVALTPMDASDRASFGESRGSRRAYALGRLVGIALGGVIGVWIAIWLIGRRRAQR
jgi:hypothetical protein